MASIVAAGARSVWCFVGLVLAGNLHLSHRLLAKSYAIDEGGTYTVFRQTESMDSVRDSPVVLVVGFRLKLIGNNRIMHWVFQRVCILTTPIWSGFKGFRVKLWMVDARTKNYIGIYKWAGKNHAQKYVNYLVPVLNIFSVSSSVWYNVYEVDFEEYLIDREV